MFFLRLIQFSGFYPTVGVDYDEDPPVPIPNTVVKLIRAENTWRAASRENRSSPTSFKPLTLLVSGFFLPFFYLLCYYHFVIDIFLGDFL